MSVPVVFIFCRRRHKRHTVVAGTPAVAAHPCLLRSNSRKCERSGAGTPAVHLARPLRVLRFLSHYDLTTASDSTARPSEVHAHEAPRQPLSYSSVS